MKNCKHKFELDGAQCIKCGKTVTEILTEKQETKNMKLTKEQLEKNEESLKVGFFNWNTLSLDQMVEYLEEKHMFSSTGESKCIFELITFYKKHKNDKI